MTFANICQTLRHAHIHQTAGLAHLGHKSVHLLLLGLSVSYTVRVVRVPAAVAAPCVDCNPLLDAALAALKQLQQLRSKHIK